MITARWILTAGLALVGLTITDRFALAQSAPAKWADTLSGEIERAYESGDLAKVQAARALAERVATAYPNDGLILHYEAFAIYREAAAKTAQGEGDAAMLYTRAADLLEQSIKVHPLAESHALLSSIDGNLIAHDPSRAMELGMASQASSVAAMSLGPRNPRVWLIRGISSMFTPPEYGGGVKAAREQLEHAVELFTTDNPKAGDPSWGYAEAYIWLGQAYEKSNDEPKAAGAFKRAHEIAPNFAWARSLAGPPQ